MSNGRPIDPIAALGRDRRAEIDRRLGLREGETLVLMGLGGVDMRPPLEKWPDFPGVRWLTPPNWDVARPDMVNWAVLNDCTMLDLIRSCDVLFTKPGYGAFTEAACNGTRVLYVERDDWPEEPWPSRWLLEHGNGVKIGRRQLATGELAEPVAGVAGPAGPAGGGAGRRRRGRRLAGTAASRLISIGLFSTCRYACADRPHAPAAAPEASLWSTKRVTLVSVGLISTVGMPIWLACTTGPAM
ncbi:MAG: hypothetical protein MZV65_13625 [Chromatiales bacterium]|nr:hypothetical protein [Chromatiales bacterium]